MEIGFQNSILRALPEENHLSGESQPLKVRILGGLPGVWGASMQPFRRSLASVSGSSFFAEPS